MKVLDEITGLTYDDVPPLWPFQAMVNKRADALPDCKCVDECRCAAGIQPRVNKSTIYHAIRKLGRWEKAAAARLAFVRRLVASDCPRSKATDLSWRLFEDMLWGAEGESGFDLAVIDFELDAMVAYGEEREYPEKPSEADIAATLAEARATFGVSHFRLPTTVVHFYKRLGLWDLASKYLRRDDPDGDEVENVSTSVAWRVLGSLLSSLGTVADIAERLKQAAEPRRPK